MSLFFNIMFSTAQGNSISHNLSIYSYIKQLIYRYYLHYYLIIHSFFSLFKHDKKEIFFLTARITTKLKSANFSFLKT